MATSAADRVVPRRSPPLLAEQLAAGVLGAVALAIGDAVHASWGAVDLPTGALAAAHTVAFYAPAGALAGALGALVIALLRATPALVPLLRIASAPHLWFAPAPRALAPVVGWLAAVGLAAFVAREAYTELTLVAHRVDLAAWSMAAIVAGALAVGALLTTAVRAVFLAVAPHLGRLASPGALALALAGGATYGAARWLRSQPTVLEVYASLVWLVPLALGAYAIATVAMRVLLSRVRRRWAVALSAALVLGSLAGWVASALTYGRVNEARSIVEDGTLAGGWLLRRYLRLSDLDGDRFAWGFGGRDCDDFDPRVHPGALDEPGDGLDLDCFAGDGAPVVERPGDGHYGARPAGLEPRPSFVLVTIDALRPDHLGFEGYSRDTSPNLDAFAQSAVRFREVLASSSRSIRSIPGMFTGLHPSQIAYGNEYLYPSLLAENETLAEVLERHGWYTAVTMGTEYFHRVRGFYQGFSDVEEILEYKPPRQQTVDRAIAQLDRAIASGRPFFQWIHIFNVHEPYLRPPHPSRYGEAQLDKYDTEIRLADEQLQRVLDALRERELDRRVVVIVASDHGEAFYEHGTRGHARTLYQEEVRSLLLLRIPGVRPRRVDATVSLLDVTPTVLNLAGVDVPHPMSGRSLVPLATGEREPDPERWFFGELLPDGLFPFDVKSIRQGRWKLHWWVRDGRIQLFDLEDDPGERRDLSDEREAHALELLGTLQAWVARSSRAEQRNASFVRSHLLREPPERMTHPLGLRYPGLFTVLGCDVPRTTVRLGETLDVTCYYQVDGTTDDDLFFRVTFDGPPGWSAPRDMHAMHYPLHGRYHTNQWRAGEIIRDPMPIPLPSYATPADVWLTFAVQAPHRDGGPLVSYEQYGRPGTSARIARIRLLPPEGSGEDAGAPRSGEP